MSSYVHDILITPRGGGMPSYRALCSCGWLILRRDKEGAMVEAADHIKRVMLWNGAELGRVEMHWNPPEDTPHVG